MSPVILRGGERLLALPTDDRGLNYGDGVFETILVHQGCMVWWPEHWQRLMLGARLLGIPVPDERQLKSECEQLAGGHGRAVLKLVLTRGSGGRGYLPPADEAVIPTVVLSLHDAPETPATPITLRWSETRLAVQPLLAGFKHLNRLEQVLARSEWRDADVFEGLMCDGDDRVICATSANVFIRHDGGWITPRVDRCGIAGVARGWLLCNVEDSEEADFGRETLLSSEAVFLCNSVRGILPVGRLGDRQWPAHAAIDELRARLAQVEPAFEPRE